MQEEAEGCRKRGRVKECSEKRRRTRREKIVAEVMIQKEREGKEMK